MKNERFEVTGMTCSACSSHVERAVTKVPGVKTVAVSLLTNSMQVRYDAPASPAAIAKAVERAGYGASQKGAARTEKGERLWPRLAASILLLLLLMYLTMGHVMLGWPIPVAATPMSLALCELLLTALVMVINQRFFVRGYRSLLHGAPSMDTLIAMGAGAAFVYSAALTFAMAQTPAQAEHLLHCLYFESAAMILTLITVGKLLEERSRGKTTSAIRSLLSLAPETATVLRDGRETVIPAQELRLGETFLVRPGERIPADGTVLEGHSAVNEAALTGESLPAEKAPGSTVAAATLNQQGHLTCRATSVGSDTTLQKIIALVRDAAATKAPIAKLADRVAGVFVPAVIGIAVVTCLVWVAVGKPFGFALARAISVLVISCPCALGLATPVAIMVGSGVGAKHGILFKTAAALEHTGRARTVVLDKTGTVTRGEPAVTDVLPAPGVTRDALVSAACALEAKSEHPLSKAVAALGKTSPAEDFAALPGFGVEGRIGGKRAVGGSMALLKKENLLSPELEKTGEALAEDGKTPLYFALDGRLLGCIAVADVIREDSAEAVRELHGMGLQTVMLTGDNERTAKAIAKRAGLDRVIAGVLPAQKEAAIRELQQGGLVVMVGDGINDAPALTRADVGFAIGAGADVAMDAADVVLMKSSLMDVAAAIGLSRQTLKNIRENLFWAFFYNCIGIPLAAGALIPAFGLELSPMFGALAMSLSSLCVVSNALRLNLWKPQKTTKTEEKTMKKTIYIEGMMCAHCVAHVKKALEALSGIEDVDVSLDEGKATMRTGVSDETLRAVVAEAGYTVTRVEG